MQPARSIDRDLEAEKPRSTLMPPCDGKRVLDMVDSQQLGWSDVFLRFLDVPAGMEVELPPAPQHTLIVQMGPKTYYERLPPQEYRFGPAHPGDVTIIPANTASHWRWDRRTQCAHLFLDPAALDRAGPRALQGPPRTLLSRFAVRDPLVEELTRELLAEMRTPKEGQRRYVDTLMAALAMHLLRRHSRPTMDADVGPEGLPADKLQRVLAYIETHLGDNITLADMAREACLSPYYFARQFKASTGVPPRRFLLERRLDAAKKRLLETDRPLIELAYELGFANQSHFTASFRQYTGITPRAFRRAG